MIHRSFDQVISIEAETSSQPNNRENSVFRQILRLVFKVSELFYGGEDKVDAKCCIQIMGFLEILEAIMSFVGSV